MTIEDFILNANGLSAESIIFEAASKNTDELADLNVLQLESGLMSTGAKLRPEYSTTTYAKYKKSIGSKSSPTPDLKLTGAFHEAFYVKPENGKIKFGSNDSKEGKLQQDYGDDIFGVTTDNLINTIDPDIPDIIDKMLMK